MNKERAILVLKGETSMRTDEWMKALDLAIKALEQDPTPPTEPTPDVEALKEKCRKEIQGTSSANGLIDSVSAYHKVMNAIDEALALKKGERRSFKWMEEWLTAYSKKHELDVKKIMDWINEQPMCAG